MSNYTNSGSYDYEVSQSNAKARAARLAAPTPPSKVQITGDNLDNAEADNAPAEVKIRLGNEHTEAVEADVTSWEHWNPKSNSAEQWNVEQWKEWKKSHRPARHSGSYSGSYQSGSYPYSGSYQSGSYPYSSSYQSRSYPYSSSY